MDRRQLAWTLMSVVSGLWLLSQSGPVVRVDIFTYYFVYLKYFPIILIYLKILFYRLSFDIIFA